MKIKHQLSIATLVMVGFFATGCSQQTADGGSQVSGGSQQAAGESQVSGGSQQQVEGGAQVSGGSQQQVEEAVVAPARAPAKAPMAAPAPAAPVVVAKPRTNRWTHTHPAIPRCTKSIRHTHKYNSARHSHKYGCNRPARRAAPVKPAVDVYALQRKLQAKGYYKGPIDGVVGPGTRNALKRFMNR